MCFAISQLVAPWSNLADFCQSANFSFCFGSRDKKDVVKSPRGILTLHGSSEILWSKVDADFPSRLRVHFTLRCIGLLKSQDPTSEKKTDEMVNLAPLQPDKIWQKLWIYREYSDFSYEGHLQDPPHISWVLMPYGLWSRNLYCPSTSFSSFSYFCLNYLLSSWELDFTLAGKLCCTQSINASEV